jgi:hypothetical protein
MTLQRYTRPITKDDKSLKLETFEGNQWDASTFNLRFPLTNYREANPADQCEEEQYAHQLIAQNGVTAPIRITPSADPPNCRFTGGLGVKRIVRLDGKT